MVAAHDHISQNELIEQALANEVLVRGATIVADLELAAQSLVELTDAQHQQIVAKSLKEFGQGEGLPEPLQVHALDLRMSARTEATQPERNQPTVLP